MSEPQIPLDDPLAPSAEPQRQTSTAVLEREQVEEQLQEPGDHERFAHYVDRDKATEATVLGTPVVALCGKVWVPSRDPKKYPVCPECQRLYDLGPEGRTNEWNERASSGED